LNKPPNQTRVVSNEKFEKERSVIYGEKSLFTFSEKQIVRLFIRIVRFVIARSLIFI